MKASCTRPFYLLVTLRAGGRSCLLTRFLTGRWLSVIPAEHETIA
jgi:hypothetical protein